MDEKLLEQILQDYKNEMEELKEIRAERAARYANMSEEEIVQDMAKEYEEVYEHAMKSGVSIGLIPNEDEDDEDNE